MIRLSPQPLRSAAVVQLLFLFILFHGLEREPAYSEAAAPLSKPESAFSHNLLDLTLRTWVDSSGGVNYAGLAASRDNLDSYVDSIGAVSPRSHATRFSTPGHELAYWINAYNAFVLSGVIDAYPVDSVADIGGLDAFFRQRLFVAGGDSLTLDKIENAIIRPQFRDARIHFAVNCAAISCPALENAAYEGPTLDARLDAALQRFLREDSHVRIDRQRQRLHLSRIMDWYGGDFTESVSEQRLGGVGETQSDTAPTLVDYLILHMPEEDSRYLQQHRNEVEIEFNDYDWRLNAQSP